jgi:hypothetical protein
VLMKHDRLHGTSESIAKAERYHPSLVVSRKRIDSKNGAP